MRPPASILFLLLILIFFTGLSGCSNEPEQPENLIEENAYINLLIELQLLRSYADAVQTDSLTADSLAGEIYNKYGVTGEQFRENHHYYQQFPQDQKERLDEAIERLKMDQVEEDTTRRRDTTLTDSLKQ